MYNKYIWYIYIYFYQHCMYIKVHFKGDKYLTDQIKVKNKNKVNIHICKINRTLYIFI